MIEESVTVSPPAHSVLSAQVAERIIDEKKEKLKNIENHYLIETGFGSVTGLYLGWKGGQAHFITSFLSALHKEAPQMAKRHQLPVEAVIQTNEGFQSLIKEFLKKPEHRSLRLAGILLLVAPLAGAGIGGWLGWRINNDRRKKLQEEIEAYQLQDGKEETHWRASELERLQMPQEGQEHKR